jgi:hypothetical protein
MQSAQFTVAFWEVVVGRLVSGLTSTIWPLPPSVQVPLLSCQQGATPPFDAHDGTGASTFPFRSLLV